MESDSNSTIYGIVLILIVLAGMIFFYIKVQSPGFYERDGDSGISGTVTLGPTCPVQRINETCEEPYRADISIRTEKGANLIIIRSAANGKFRVSLPPGTYTIVPLPETGLPRAAPQTVKVFPGRFVEITIKYDTGIR